MALFSKNNDKKTKKQMKSVIIKSHRNSEYRKNVIFLLLRDHQNVIIEKINNFQSQNYHLKRNHLRKWQGVDEFSGNFMVVEQFKRK